MGDHDEGPFSNLKVTVLLFGIGSAALVVSIYHCIAMGWCRLHSRASERADRAPAPRPLVAEVVEYPSIENSTVQLIPARKYQKGESLVGDDNTCSICLCEFEEGEELRTLPECAHPFHAPCIDMWLYSHASCPMCRADASPSPLIFPSSNSNNQGDNVTLEQVLVHSQL
ncbi:RING-H2 finger protein ATL52-like [Punica granatum]|uniref:RING-type E3 ubiquitin transferase n=2 Tax=Punica granatum TaxID=22663 RepID=A0A218WB08_PUNGR|nr:RING-H2 finger protein ATL52-like [Punica granatum]OWM70064.1 hypothetical protein CDL15_Pgr025913 [Punica granatum]PKI72388.1 hypothetical protein CRG98_007258 [Punica granatum]